MSRKKPPVPVLPEDVYLIDSHCHLDMDDYRQDLDQVIGRAVQHGVKGVVTIGIDLASSTSAVNIARRYSSIRSTLGFHPHDAEKLTSEALEDLAELASGNPDEVVGWGEIGLDYVKQYAPPETQRQAFRRQLQIARELKLPVIIHDREADDDCLRIIDEQGPFEHGGVMHCFSSDLDFARRMIDRNFYISIPGIVTYKNADAMKEVAARVPIERLLVETDGPFLSPVPYRGKRNEPLYTLYTAAAIADLRQTDIAEIARQTTANWCTVFNYQFNR